MSAASARCRPRSCSVARTAFATSSWVAACASSGRLSERVIGLRPFVEVAACNRCGVLSTKLKSWLIKYRVGPSHFAVSILHAINLHFVDVLVVLIDRPFVSQQIDRIGVELDFAGFLQACHVQRLAVVIAATLATLPAGCGQGQHAPSCVAKVTKRRRDKVCPNSWLLVGWRELLQVVQHQQSRWNVKQLFDSWQAVRWLEHVNALQQWLHRGGCLLHCFHLRLC